MSDGYWNMQQQQQQPHIPPPSFLKRPRSDHDYSPSGLSSIQNSETYPAWEDDAGPLVVKDSKSIASAYDRYLQSSQQASLKSGEAGTFSGVGLSGTADGGSLHHPDLLMMGQRFDLAPTAQDSGFNGAFLVDAMRRSGGPETTPLPPDASSTLYIEGLPPNTTRREVAHIFRPFVGYKEVRLVTKESKHVPGGPAILLCFVDFMDPACAATAMGALQGYKMDEDDLHSAYLRLQFSRNPGPRSGSRPRR